jgi:hypothetical protein
LTIVKTDLELNKNDQLIDYIIKNYVDLVITINQKPIVQEELNKGKFSSYTENDLVNLKYSTNSGKSYITKSKIHFSTNVNLNFMMLKNV